MATKVVAKHPRQLAAAAALDLPALTPMADCALFESRKVACATISIPCIARNGNGSRLSYPPYRSVGEQEITTAGDGVDFGSISGSCADAGTCIAISDALRSA